MEPIKGPSGAIYSGNQGNSSVRLPITPSNTIIDSSHTFTADYILTSKFSNRSIIDKRIEPFDPKIEFVSCLDVSFVDSQDIELFSSVVSFLKNYLSRLEQDSVFSSFCLRNEGEQFYLDTLTSEERLYFSLNKKDLIEKIIEKTFKILHIECGAVCSKNTITYNIYYLLASDVHKDRTDERMQLQELARIYNQTPSVPIQNPSSWNGLITRRNTDLLEQYERENQLARSHGFNNLSRLNVISFDKKTLENLPSLIRGIEWDRLEEACNFLKALFPVEGESFSLCKEMTQTSTRFKSDEGRIFELSGEEYVKFESLLSQLEEMLGLSIERFEEAANALYLVNFKYSVPQSSEKHSWNDFEANPSNLKEPTPFDKSILPELGCFIGNQDWGGQGSVVDFLVNLFPEKGTEFTFYRKRGDQMTIFSSITENFNLGLKDETTGSVLELLNSDYTKFDEVLNQLKEMIGIQYAVSYENDIAIYTVRFKYA